MSNNERFKNLVHEFQAYLSAKPKSLGSHPGLLINNWNGAVDILVLEWWDEFQCHLAIETNGKYLRESTKDFVWNEMFNGNFEHGSLFLVYFSNNKVQGFSKIGYSELVHFIYKFHQLPHHSLSGSVFVSVE